MRGRETADRFVPGRHIYPRKHADIPQPSQPHAKYPLSAYPRPLEQAYIPPHPLAIARSRRTVCEGRSGGAGVVPHRSVTADPRGPANLGPGPGPSGWRCRHSGTETQAGSSRGGGNGPRSWSSLTGHWWWRIQTPDCVARLWPHSHADYRLRGRSLAPPLDCGERRPPQPGDRTLPLAFIKVDITLTPAIEGISCGLRRRLAALFLRRDVPCRA